MAVKKKMSDKNTIKISKKHIVTGIIVVLILIGILFFKTSKSDVAQNQNIDPSPNYGPAPEITLTTTDGQTISLSQFKGKVVILQAMASWCPSCKLQAQQIKPIYEKYKNKGLVIISLDIQPERSTLESLKNFKQTYGGDWYFGFYPQFITQYNIKFLDSKVIIDKNQNIAYRDDTVTPTQKLDEIISGLI